MREDYTDINVVLDRSGSMSNIARDMEGGFNQLIKDQKKLPGKCLVSLTQFDSDFTGRPAIETIYSARPVADVPSLVLVPRGGTPLLDAVGWTIARVGERLRSLPEYERPGRVLFLVITDGGENTSREWQLPRVRAAVELQQRDYNWNFMFLGANINSFAEAGGMGFASTYTANYAPSAGGVRNMMANVSSNLKSYRSVPIADAASSLTFTEEQRTEMEKPDETLGNPTGK